MQAGTVITIGREFGSGGREIGEALAEKLNIPIYDKYIVEQAARMSGYDKEIFEEIDEKRTTSLLFSIAMNLFPYTTKTQRIDEFSFSDKLYAIQKEVICSLAAKGPCIVIGRCSNYILKKEYHCINVFIYSQMANRIKRVCERYHTDEISVREWIDKMDKKRSSYYNYYTGEKWGDRYTYDLLLDSSVLGIKGSVELLERYVEMKLSI